MTPHPIIWTEPSPFWSEATTPSVNGIAQPQFNQPAILRFTTDSFMEEFFNVLATDPLRLGEYRIQPETWRGIASMPAPERPAQAFAIALQRLGLTRRRLTGAGPGGNLPSKPPPSVAPPGQPLKLYQPAHQRYYLVTSCLVCQIAGLPDRKLDTGKHERASFVIRRLFPPDGGSDTPITTWDEYGWLPGTGNGSWEKLGNNGSARQLLPDEERLPLFAVNFTQDDQRRRRLFAGLIPVAKREAYLGAGLSNPPITTKTSRKILLRKEVIEPWKQLIDRAAKVKSTLAETIDGNPTPHQDTLIKAAREQIQTVSWYILLDFARYLHDYIPNVYQSILGNAPDQPLNPAQQTLLTTLNTIKVGSDLVSELKGNSALQTVAASLSDALLRIGAHQTRLEQVDSPYDRSTLSASWPDFLFPLADPSVNFSAEAPLPPSALPANLTPDESQELDFSEASSGNDPDKERVDHLAVLVVRALPDETPAAEPAVPLAAIPPKDAINGWFVIRCAYERPSCGPLHDDSLSAATEPFQLAGFFDPDAPARPIRIGLPLDTTPAGLRKFDKNTAFFISDLLCGQIKRLGSVTFGDLVRSVLPWPLHKDLSAPDSGPCQAGPGGPNFGTICSLSIPIITLCAFFLLIIMIFLLDIIFFWLPYFIICFPIPGLKTKK
jgi:hypothetical protein